MSEISGDNDEAIAALLQARPMTVATLIAALQTIERDFGGELPVAMEGRTIVREAVAYDAEGNSHGARVEVVLHGWGTARG